ncbi:23S rRNA (guanosine(2251)-2'-O)-methyltransferase RlmB [Jiella sp. MQZ9-1]|uniref:23S rRNA (Guanosine(2251)-2'-O)-methyltransferase RlmB n=1 Tax=Jiella flava TaxID=2816857 RepID=A0A939G1Z8_9HYPH|nr:23S rRNA (guanosine(2251)-2'-O)-methyltransferase RlmB [Jiella flava]MBO0664405.1 23S rRNA (guanosine(2251)-2'-O)-methyltransferase RlmB [Jiella flava]MCD2473040.1 23S rRNA (guanosine(2251)-2'-O)-methyltransferase RlmB [Jiella flava]
MSDETSGTPKDSHYARLRRSHRDAKRAKAGEPQGRFGHARPAGDPSPGRAPAAGRIWLYGLHTVSEALKNPRRKLHRLLATRNALARLEIDESALPCTLEQVEPKALIAELGSEAVHQGVALETEPLIAKRLGDLANARLVLVLDQVTDPHNVGAILRSATAFAADAVVTTSRHSPQEGGVLAKAASGALEHVTQIEVRNLAEALESLASQGFFTVGLDSEGPETFEASLAGDKLAIVLGAEGKGLRQKTRATVARLARLPMPGAIHSLNVSNAAAIALYAASRHLNRD